VVTGQHLRLRVTVMTVEGARGLVAGARLERDSVDAGDLGRALEPCQHFAGDATASMRRLHRQQQQVGFLVAVFHEAEAGAVGLGGGRDSQPRKRADGSHEFATLRDYAGRGVVTTSTYEARKLGVFSAMGMMKSALLAPDAILLPVDFDEYRKYSRLFKSAVREIAPVIEDRGIDEIYVDLSDEPGVHDDAWHAIGSAIKAAVHERTGLTCSIGITPNKLL